MAFQIQRVAPVFTVEQVETPRYFPNISVGAFVDGRLFRLEKNNLRDTYAIDWTITIDNKPVAWIDSEHKKGWTNGHYRLWSVAIYSYRYNTDINARQHVSNKVHTFRTYPKRSFWMAIKSDKSEAGIIIAETIICSPVVERNNAQGMVRPISIYEFSESDMVFCKPDDNAIEEYVIGKILEAGQ